MFSSEVTRKTLRVDVPHELLGWLVNSSTGPGAGLAFAAFAIDSLQPWPCILSDDLAFSDGL